MTTKTFTDKVKEILGSVRFWIVTLTAIVAILEAQTGGAGLAEILEIVKIWLITVAGIGTADSIASKIGGAQKTETDTDEVTQKVIELLKADSKK